MSIHSILEQLEMSHGKPDTMSLFNNDVLFRSPFPPTEALEMLFYCIKLCQEIKRIAQDPYTPEQIIGNAIHLLRQLGIFSVMEFDTWEVVVINTYLILQVVHS
jgi:hypothetical protein